MMVQQAPNQVVDTLLVVVVEQFVGIKRLHDDLGVNTAKLTKLYGECHENGNSFKRPQTTTNVDGSSTLLIPGPVTTEEKVQKKNDVKARSGEGDSGGCNNSDGGVVVVKMWCWWLLMVTSGCGGDDGGVEVRRYGVSVELDTAYQGFLGVGTTHKYAVSSLMDMAYRMSESVSSYFFV
ncbi:hypothetical protein Tco_0575763 [Tanacetum coccineum]